MDIRATLTLDTAPFEAALSSAVAAAGRLAGAAGSLASAAEEAQARIDALSAAADGAGKAQGAATDAAEGLADAQGGATDAAGTLADAQRRAADAAKEQGEAQKTAAGATDNLATAQRKAASAAKEQGKAQKDAAGATAAQGEAAKAAQAGMSAFGATASAMSGDVRGAAVSMLSLSRATQGVGIAMKAVPVVAIAAAAAAVVAGVTLQVSRLIAARRQMRLDNAFENAAASARSLAGAVGLVNSRLERAASLRGALAGIAGGREDRRADIARANLERERQEALRGRTAEERDAINADFDRRAANLAHETATGAATRKRDELGAQRSDNQAQIDALKEQLADAVAKQAAATAKALEARASVAEKTNAAGGLGAVWYRQTIAQDTAEAERYESQMASLGETIKSAGEKIQALEDRNTQLAAAMDAAGDDIALADANLGAALAEIDARPEKPEDGGKAGKGGLGQAAIATDRLARIGGYVGGAAPMKKSEDLLQKANDQRERLIAATESLANARAKFG